MPKIDTYQVAEILKRTKVDPVVARIVVEEMNRLAEVAAAQESEPAVKKQFVILVSDPEGQLTKPFSGWVLQVAESENVFSTTERIFRAVDEFKTTKRGRLFPTYTVGDALENVPSKHFREYGLWVKTKTPVVVLRTDNQLPRLEVTS
jgi:hypothetical protein